MTGVRIGVCKPGSSSREILGLVCVAEHFGLDSVWVGDPATARANSDPEYVLTTIAAAGAVTQDVRLGAFLHLGADVQILRIAEDIGVVDAITRGRLELCIVGASDDETEWEDAVTRLTGAHRRWPLPDGQSVYAVSPQPQQPRIPLLLMDTGPAALERFHAGALVRWESAPAERTSRQRTVLLFEPKQPVTAWLHERVVEAMQDLRKRAEETDADDVVVMLAADDDAGAAASALGCVVGPCLRCAPHEVDQLAYDSHDWHFHKQDLHRPPDRVAR